MTTANAIERRQAERHALDDILFAQDRMDQAAKVLKAQRFALEQAAQWAETMGSGQ